MTAHASIRDFGVLRRRPGIVDILTPKQPGVVKGYRFQAATNFDGSFVTLFTADIGSGYLDGTINPVVLTSVNNQDAVRVVFNPNTFTGTAGITDDQHFWLRMVPIDFAGSVGTAGSPGLIIPDDETHATGRVIIRGSAPNGAAIANSLRLDFPCRMQDLHIRNNEASGGTTLFVATAVGGSERPIAPQEVSNMYQGAAGCLFVRGGGAIVNFSADFTQYLPL